MDHASGSAREGQDDLLKAANEGQADSNWHYLNNIWRPLKVKTRKSTCCLSPNGKFWDATQVAALWVEAGGRRERLTLTSFDSDRLVSTFRARVLALRSRAFALNLCNPRILERNCSSERHGPPPARHRSRL